MQNMGFLSNPSIYSAGKVYNAERFREMRDKRGYNINARWIDLNAEQSKDKKLVWKLCHADACSADMVVIYCHKPNDYLLGTLVEAGHAMGKNKPVYCINSCIHTVENELSDCAYTSHPLWHNLVLSGGKLTIEAGYRLAIQDYCENFWG